MKAKALASTHPKASGSLGARFLLGLTTLGWKEEAQGSSRHQFSGWDTPHLFFTWLGDTQYLGVERTQPEDGGVSRLL